MPFVFYYYPITCATAAHIVLLESGLEFERELINLDGGLHLQTNYLETNPKGSVPALKTTQGLLTENQAILSYIADLVPEKHLIAEAGSFARAQMHEWMNYCAASIHPAVRSVFRPLAVAGEDQLVRAGVREHGYSLVKKCCSVVEAKLTAGEWSVGEKFSVADAYLYLMYLWTRDKRMGEMPECPKWNQLALRVHARPATQTALKVELAQRADYQLPIGFNRP